MPEHVVGVIRHGGGWVGGGELAPCGVIRVARRVAQRVGAGGEVARGIVAVAGRDVLHGRGGGIERHSLGLGRGDLP